MVTAFKKRIDQVNMNINYWLIKTEPSCWSWQDQIKHKVTAWDGVRNYQASNNLKAMQVGDLAFFYHSIVQKSIQGIVRVTRPYYPDPSDLTARFGMVDVEYYSSFDHPVTLVQIKDDPLLNHLPLVRQSRLSVMPIDHNAWLRINVLSHLKI